MCSIYIADNVDKTMMVQSAAMNCILHCTVEAIIKNSYTMFLVLHGQTLSLPLLLCNTPGGVAQ